MRAPVLFDPVVARRDVERFAAAVPHARLRVAVPTYRVVVAGTPLAADPREVAGFVRTLEADPIAGVVGIAWFRLPVSSDRATWRTATLAAAIANRPLDAHVATRLVARGPNTYDLVLANTGTLDVRYPQLRVGGAVAASDVIAPPTDRTLPAGSEARRRLGHRKRTSRSMRTSPLVITAALFATTLLAARPARACGPDFDTRWLADRTSALFELAPEKFTDAVGDLVPVPAEDARFEHDVDHADDDNEGEGGKTEEVAIRARGGTEERELYDAGALAFDAGRMAEARASFRALLALPADRRHQRSTWAAYMIARSYGPFDNTHLAIAAYEEVRTLTRAGYLDELHLAASSLGQEARLLLRIDEDVRAVRLYAEQAALGHPDGAPSLLIVARQATRFPDDRARLLGDAVGQRLIASYLATRGDELDATVRDAIWREVVAIPKFAGADRLAAVAYAHGDWMRAGQLALVAPHERRSVWVLAKLAARDAAISRRPSACSPRRRRPAATRPPTRASRATGSRASGRSSRSAPIARATRSRVRGRRARPRPPTWRTSPSAPSRSTSCARSSTRCRRRARSPRPTTTTGRRPRTRCAICSRAASCAPAAPTRRRRTSRRRTPWPRGCTPTRSARGRDASADPFARAAGLIDAASVARHDGLEILGTEAAPDWNLYGAQYDRGEEDRERERDRAGADSPPQPATFDEPTASERARVDDSAPARPEGDYHYRYVASALAEQAADLLPHRSQAFAASLCLAAKYIFFLDEDRKDRLYHRYLAEGPAVDFAGTFGQECPAPEIERARRFVPTPAQRAARAHRHVPRSTLVLLSCACLAAAYLLARRLTKP